MTPRPTALVACALGLIRQGHDPDAALRAAVQRIPCSVASVRLAEAILAAMLTAPAVRYPEPGVSAELWARAQLNEQPPVGLTPTVRS